MKNTLLLAPLVVSMLCSGMAQAAVNTSAANTTIVSTAQVGSRPYYLIDRMADSPLKEKLLSCANIPFRKTEFSIGHRGASMKFPEHTAEAYRAAARQGAGIVECDVTFTKDKQLVCRHAQDDLHTTTNILGSLAQKCTTPFVAAKGDKDAVAECRASISPWRVRTLKGKMDGANAKGEC